MVISSARVNRYLKSGSAIVVASLERSSARLDAEITAVSGAITVLPQSENDGGKAAGGKPSLSTDSQLSEKLTTSRRPEDGLSVPLQLQMLPSEMPCLCSETRPRPTAM